MLRPMLEAVPGWRRWQRAPFSQLWRRLCALRTAPQLHPRTHNPTNSTTPKFQISTRAAIGNYDSWKFDFSKPFWISWWSVFMVPFEKSRYFFGERFLDCLRLWCVACCSTAPGCPAWLLQQQPEKALEVNCRFFVHLNSYFLQP